MTRGRPAMRVGQHGKITRQQVSPGVWNATCYFRGPDGKRREVQRRSPRGEPDRHGAAAEEALVKRLDELTELGQADDDATVTGRTLVSDLLERHLDALRGAGRAPRTLYSYGLRVNYWNAIAGGITVEDCTAGRLQRLVERVRSAHGNTDAKQLGILLAAALDLAVADGVFKTNPARAMKPPPKKKEAKGQGATPIDPDVLPTVLKALIESQRCRDKDLTDPMLLHLATGLRVSEVLGFLWEEFDPEAKTIAVSGRVVWAKGEGLLRTSTLDSSKGAAPLLALPQFAVDMLLARSQEERLNLCGAIFPSAAGTLRDPNGFARQWREVRGELGEHLEKATGHSFRKTMGDLVTDLTANPQVAADVLGHSDMQTTIKHYLSRGRAHPEVATMVDYAVRGRRKVTKRSAKRRV
jgi:integrase